jgi:hypothetical protein
MPSSAHQVQPTPPPMTGALGIGNAHSATIAVTGPSGSGPRAAPPRSGVYPGASVSVAQKSKAGLIIAIVAVLAVGGGVAAFVVVNNKDPGRGPGSGSDRGSQIASNDRGSSDRGSNQVDHGSAGSTGSGGSATISQDGSGSSEGSDGPGSNAGSNHAGSDDGSDHAGSNVETDRGSDAGSNTSPPVEVVQVPLFARNGVVFEVFENGTKLFDGPDNLEVPRGEKRTVVIKARGFKDKTIVVEGKKKKVQFSLIAVNGGSGSGHVIIPPPPPPPPGPNCSNAIVEPKNKACVAQYCAKHPEDENKCGLE